VNPQVKSPWGVKSVIYILGVISAGWLAWEIYTYFYALSPWFRDFFMDIEAESFPTAVISVPEIIGCIVAVILFIAALVVYLMNMSNLGYRPFQLLYLIAAAVAGFLIFGIYYGSLWLKLYDDPNAKTAITVMMIAGAVIYVAELVVMIIKKTFRAVPLWLFYILLGYLISVLAIAVVQAVLLLIGIAVIAGIWGSFGSGKKRIRGSDGKIYEEI